MNLHTSVTTSYQQTISSLIQADLSDMFKTDANSASTMTIVISPDPLSPTKSTSSATIMPDTQSPGPAQHW
jgi:anthranilate/para-aminobenzoate synthase component II